jgi:hypothetical protein
VNRWFGVAIALIGAAVACKSGDKESAPEPPAEPVVPTAPHEPSRTALATLEPAPAGPAYFATSGRGVAELSADGEFRATPTRPMAMTDIAAGPAAGEVYAWNINRLNHVRDGKLVAVHETRGISDGPAMPDEYEVVVTAPDGTLWTANDDHVGHYRDGRWILEDLTHIKDFILEPNDIEFDGEGRVWLAMSEDILVREDGEWRLFDVSKIRGDLFHPKGIEFGADGALYIATSNALFKQTGDEWSKLVVGAESYPMIIHFELGPNDEIYTADIYDIRVAPPGGGYSATYTSQENRNFVGRIDAFAVDDSGRIWVGTEADLYVIERGGAAIHRYQQGSVRELSAIDGIVVEAGGPKLPPAPAVKVGEIRGRFKRNGVDLGGASVQVCTSPAMMFHESPCEDEPWSQLVTASPNGSFLFTDVPLGVYGFAVRDRGARRWTITMGGCCAAMKPGTTFDVGTTDLD